MPVSQIRRLLFQNSSGIFYALTLDISSGTGDAKYLGPNATVSPTAGGARTDLTFTASEVEGFSDSYISHAALFNDPGTGALALNSILTATT